MTTLRTLAAQLACLAFLGFCAAAPSTAGQGPAYTYFPSASTTDGRMLSFGSSAIATLVGASLRVKIRVPASASSFEIGVFDGDTGKDGQGRTNPAAGHWDLGTADVEYELLADPQGDGSGAARLGRWGGNTANQTSGPLWSAPSATMPDNDWWTLNVQTSEAARSTAGDFVYNLEVHMPDNAAAASSNFKLRTTGSLSLRSGVVTLEGALRQISQDGRSLYPDWDGRTFPRSGRFWLDTRTTYDGTWTFYMDVPEGVRSLTFWDGDFDHGTSRDRTVPSGLGLPRVQDADDPDSRGQPVWAAETAAAGEGKRATGLPPDDGTFDIVRRSPSITYEAVDPTGKVYRNSNPSGNQEWEGFRITTDPVSTRSSTDYGPAVSADGSTVVTGSTLPAGLWQLRLTGVDLANTMALRFPYPIRGVDAADQPAAGEVPPLLEDACRDITAEGTIPVTGPRGQEGTATFSIQVTCLPGGKFRGKVKFTDPVRRRKIVSTKITGGDFNGPHATILGKAKVNRRGRYSFAIDVFDLGTPGAGLDTFAIRVSKGYRTAVSTLTTGEITLAAAPEGQ